MTRKIVDSTIVTADGKKHHIVVTSPFGAGMNVYHVYVDNYLNGQIVPGPDGLIPFIQGDVLTGDDIGAILDIINEANA